MLLQKRFPRDMRHFMVMKRVISSPLSSVLIDEIRCRGVLWARDLTQKGPQRPNLRRSWAIYLIQKRHDIEEMTEDVGRREHRPVGEEQAAQLGGWKGGLGRGEGCVA